MFGFDGWRRRFAHDPGPARRNAAGLGIAASDIDELTALATQVASEYGLSSPVVVSATLARLLRRQVPVRAVQPAQGRCLGGLQFADGTVVLVRGRHAGDLGKVAAGVHFGVVRLADFHAASGAVTLELSYGTHRDELCALGITQPV
ncbi:MAG: hypothetical protein QM779_06540 [Propionicimonas sp.]|uniref:hypothetical protein n=1 Tax=Propionicimonas sp. TaxID=1955623 RepID=UPI003D126DD2